MQDYVTKQYLTDLGIDVDDTTVESLLAHLNETIEERIGAEITESLSDDQLKQLIDFQETASDEQLGAWIAKQVPDYQQIVQDNIDIVISELVEGADDVNAAA